MNNLKEFFTSNKAKAFYWQTANGFVGLAIIFFTDVEWQYAPIVIALLNATTEYINQNYL